jgi:hypothetical protein
MPEWQKQLLQSAPDKRVAEKLQRAISKLLEIDGFLLRADVNERSLSHKLAEYIASEFPDWNVDCEYNRDGHEPKRVQLEPVGVESDDTYGTTVFPDIIVHKRGERDNLLAIEIKKSNNPRGNGLDFRKLAAYQEQLAYQHAVFICFDTGPVEFGVAEAVFSAVAAG